MPDSTPGVADLQSPLDPNRSPGRATAILQSLGRFAIESTRHAGRSAILFCATLLASRHPRRYWREAATQAKRVGVDALALVLLVGALSGSLLSQQTGYQIQGSLPLSLVGTSVVSGMFTELGPVLTAIVLAGRMGAGIGAELGTMKVTDQVDALVTLGRDPVVELVLPRVVGGMIAMIPLVILANAIGIFAGWVTAISLLPMSTAEYVAGARAYNYGPGLLFALIKAPILGFIIPFIACYVGLRAEGGAAGVGRTATSAVVAIIVAIMIVDVVMAPLYKALT